jgi:hypothetical protein
MVAVRDNSTCYGTLIALDSKASVILNSNVVYARWAWQT